MLPCLYLAIFIFFLSSYMFTPFFSLYVTALGGSYAEFAAVLSLAGFLVSIIQSYIGYLSDKVGSRFLMIGGGILSTLGYLLIGITYHRFLIIPLYLLINIGMGILVPSAFTLISYQKTAKGDSFIPIYRSIQGAGVIIGPVAGGWLMGQSYRINALLGGILMMVSIVLFSVYFLNRSVSVDEPNRGARSAINFKETMVEIIHNRSFLVILILFTFVELSYDLIYMSLPLVGTELNFSTDVTGTALSAYFLMFTLFQIPINRALKKIKKRTALMSMGLLALVPCVLLLLNIPAFFTILCMGGIGLTIGSLFTFCTMMASEESPENKKGTFLGIFNTIMPLTDVISPVIVAFFISLNVKLPYAAAAILVLLFIMISSQKVEG